jgi:hypothetical protein
MTALTEDKQIELQDGVEEDFPVAASQKIFGGALACVNAAGYALEGSDTAGLIFQGIAMNQKDNSSGANGDLDVVLKRHGLMKVIMDTAISQANVGDDVFLVDDQTADLIANVTHGIYCGRIAKYIDSTHAWIDIEAACKEAPVPIADPGDAGAIPVSRSAVVALTTEGAETRTIAIPGRAGITLAISLDVDGGDATVTVAAAINQTGNNTIVLGDAGDFIMMESVQVAGALVWRMVVNDGCTLSTV